MSTLKKFKAPRAKRKAKEPQVQPAPAAPPSPEQEVMDIYEAGLAPWFGRSWIYEGVNNATTDITPTVRVELMRRARNFEKNDPLPKRICSVWNQYVFGSMGLAMIPSTSTDSFNDIASSWYRGWSKHPAISSRHPLSVLQHVMGRRWLFDGEIFIHLCDYKGQPRIQLVESQRVKSPGADKAKNGNKIIDGVEIDEDGAPVAYYVSSGQQPPFGSLSGGIYPDAYANSGLVARSYPYSAPNETFERVPVEEMLHLFEPERADQYRGISTLYSLLNTLHDLYDLKKYEMLAAKDQAETSKWVTNQSGTAPTKNLMATKLSIPTTDAAGNAVTKQTAIYRQGTLGGSIKYLRPGEDVKFASPTRPTQSTVNYFDFLLKSICMGAGTSPLLVFPFSLQGTVARGELDFMAGYFRTKSGVAGSTLLDLYTWSIGWGIRFDRRLDGFPRDWAEAIVRPPRSVNVDVGRNSQALIAEYLQGFRTLADVCAELGHDWRQVLKQKFREAAYLKQLEQEFPGVSKDDVIQSLAKQGQQPAKAEFQAEVEAANEEVLTV